MWRKSLSGLLSRTIPLAALLMASTTQADVLWSNPWTYTTPMPFTAWNGPSISFTTDGGLIIGADSASRYDWQNTRLNSDGSLRWTAYLNGFEYGSGGYLNPAIEMDDGGAIVSWRLDNPYSGSEISRLDPTGAVQWSRSALVQWSAMADPDHVVYLGCNALTLADAETGDIVWQRIYDRNVRCENSNGAIDDVGNIFAIFYQGDLSTITGIRLAKFDSIGTLLWETTLPATSGGLIAGIGTNSVYVNAGTELLALSTTDGSNTWSLPVSSGAQVLVTADPAKDAIVGDSASIRRLAAADGSVVWTMADSSCNSLCKVSVGTDGAILANINSNLSKVDATTGIADWTTPLPFQDAGGNSLSWLKFGGVTGNRLLGVGLVFTFGSYAAHFQEFDYSSGTLMNLIPVPDTAQGAYGLSLVSGGDVFDVAFGPDRDSQPIRVRRSDAATGSMLWETSHAPLTAPYEWFGHIANLTPYAAVGANSIAVNLPWSRSDVTGTEGLFTISLFDRASGSLLWSKLVQESGQQQTNMSGPQFDSAGNVFVGVGTIQPCGSFSTCGYQYIYKFSALNGDVLWRFDNEIGSFSVGYGFPQEFEVLGDDVVVAGTFSGTTNTLLRISGVDASPVWSSDLFAGAADGVGLYRQDDQHIIVESGTQSARVDINSGSVLWTSTSPSLACAPSCSGQDQLVLSNGDLVRIGFNSRQAWLLRAYNDGSGLVDFWWLNSYDPQLRPSAGHVRQTPSGNIMLIASRSFLGSPGSSSQLQEFDLSSGMVVSQQAISSAAWDGISESQWKSTLEFPEDNRMLFSGYRVEPTSPNATGAGLLDTTITAHGDLSLSINADLQSATPGQPLDFSMVINYTGDLAISGANVFAGMRIQGNANNLSCATQSASNCVFDERSGNVHATFDIQPGGSITITGQLEYFEQNPLPYFSGVVQGPVSLSEPDTVNNFSRVWTVDALFQDGFDQ